MIIVIFYKYSILFFIYLIDYKLFDLREGRLLVFSFMFGVLDEIWSLIYGLGFFLFICLGVEMLDFLGG